MNPSTIQGPQGQLVALRINSAKGRGLPLVFVHADPGRASQWEAVMALMADTHDMTAFDFRGSGASTAPADSDYSYAGRAADIAAVVDALHIKRFVIVAHSAGAAVALTYAAVNSGRVAGIVMVDPFTDPRAMPAGALEGLVKDMSGPNSAQVFKSYVESIAGPNPAVRRQVIADAQTHDATGRAGMAKALGMWNPETTLKAFKGALCALVSDGTGRGSKTPITTGPYRNMLRRGATLTASGASPTNAQRAFKGPVYILSTPATDISGALYRLRPDIPHEVVANEGHWIQMDKLALVQKAIERFMSKLDANFSEGTPPQHATAVAPEDLPRLFVLRANAGDVEGLVALYEPDAALALPDGKVANGAEAIRRFYAEMLSKQPKLVAGDQGPALLNGDLALTSSRLANGTVTAEIARRQPDGSWLWAVDQPAVSVRAARVSLNTFAMFSKLSLCALSHRRPRCTSLFC